MIIIGGGPAGYAAALRAVRRGMKVTLIDADNGLGGTCMNRGCIPTKALLESSYLYARAKSGQFGVNGDVTLDMDAVFRRKDDIVAKMNKGIGTLVFAGKIDYRVAKAKLLSDTQVEISTGEVLEDETIVLAVGSHPVVPRAIKGIELAKTSDEILSRQFGKYTRVAVIGGGVIGVELATFFSQVGSSVTILEGLPRLLAPFPADVMKYLGLSMRKSGIKMVTNAMVTSLEKSGNADLPDEIAVSYTEKEKENRLLVDLVIVCVGRAANTIEGLDACGVAFDRGIVTDAECKTGNPHIYAVGDCAKGNIQLAHFATAQAVGLVDRLAGYATHADLKTVPACVYTNPPVAKVGLSQEEAAAAGFEVEIGRFMTGANGKSVIAGEDRGYVKVVFDKTNDILLGIEMVAAEAPEIIGGLSTLVAMKAKRTDILASIYPHPSVCEAFFEAVEDSLRLSIHTVYRN